MGFDVFGMCNALYDLQAAVDDTTLEELRLEKGGMVLIDEEQQRRLVPWLADGIVKTAAGGSGANTMIGVALLGGTACFTSRVGTDRYGDLYRQGLAERGVQPNLGVGEGSTGMSVVLVTPDAQRTMCTYLGRARELRSDDVRISDLQSSRYLYVTGYLWDTDTQKEAVRHAMREARRAGVPVALSLSDPFCVERHRADFLSIVRDHVDVVFANWQEAQALTGTESPVDAARSLCRLCEVSAVTMDARGSLICQGERLIEVPAFAVEAIDTTGAGDMYAAGLLYGLTHGLSLEAAGRVASYTAARVVAQFGPRLESLDLAEVAAIAE